MSEVACDDAGCEARARLSLTLTQGMTYYIFVAESFPGPPEGPVLGETLIQLRLDRFAPPEVTTSPASSISTASAQLNAVVNPNGLPTTLWFEWGGSTSYGLKTPVQLVASAPFPVARNAGIGVAGPNRYHFRVVATNVLGISLGEDESFQWDGARPEVLGLSSVGEVRTVHLRGVSRQVYWVEISGDLREWIPLGATVETASGMFQIQDFGAAGWSQRFYRGWAP
jgi:hypothetical protein